jgi:pimeloyl-ACP methyl ester carboxylesterase
MSTPRADDWRSRGRRFSWRPAEGGASSVEIFHVELGDPGAPVLALIHGWPTSSIDWFEVADQLSARFRVCALDFPGYGFSDKPRGWGYSLARDAQLVEFYLSEVVGAEAAAVVAHDRGDSVALLHAARCTEGRSAVRLEHLVLSNGNIFLPLSNLTAAQRRILDSSSGPETVAALTPLQLAEGMGASTFTPPRKTGDPEVEALAATFGHDDGVKVLHETIQYLVERSKDEQTWLSALAEAPFPVTVIWGLCEWSRRRGWRATCGTNT